MSDLMVLSFKDENTADQVLNKLNALRKEYLIDLEDAVVVIRDQKGKVRIKQSVNPTLIGAAGGATWGSLFGMLIGLIVLNPLAGLLTGAAVGAGAGALSGALADYGIDDDFIKSVGKTIEPGSSAIFMLVRKINSDKVLPELKPFGGKLLRTSLPTDQEERLKAALHDLNAVPA